MKRMLWAAAATAVIVMTGCDKGTEEKTPVEAAPAATEAAEAAGPSTTSAPAGEAVPAASGAPTFAVIYPGGEPKGPATTAMGPAGPGGLMSFTTDATPDEVVEFYRQRAEASGLKPINALTREEARAYSAGDGAGKLLNVVASPVDGVTDVQLSWTAG